MKKIIFILSVILIVSSCKKDEDLPQPDTIIVDTSDTTLSAIERQLVGKWFLDSVQSDSNKTITSYDQDCYLALSDDIHEVDSDELNRTVYRAGERLSCIQAISVHWDVNDDGNLALGFTTLFTIEVLTENELILGIDTRTFYFHK